MSDALFGSAEATGGEGTDCDAIWLATVGAEPFTVTAESAVVGFAEAALAEADLDEVTGVLAIAAIAMAAIVTVISDSAINAVVFLRSAGDVRSGRIVSESCWGVLSRRILVPADVEAFRSARVGRSRHGVHYSDAGLAVQSTARSVSAETPERRMPLRHSGLTAPDGNALP